ncbi:MAG: 1,4-dihydroxy-2-naphthoate polyprenyltransferase, partial [Thermoflexibacteraceae bacterium]
FHQNALYSMVKAWLLAFRLRTLPLALSSIFMGSFLAAQQFAFKIEIFVWAVLTTIFLQVLSNLANDYGDSQHGADLVPTRKAPKRAVQAGLITSQQMKTGMQVCGALAFVSGLALLKVSIGYNLQLFIIFLVLGIFAIIAAVTYTAGAKPYGYAGFGDISVLIFFGWVGVLGVYFLYTQQFVPLQLLPATSCGLFAVAVLNLNNIRDIESDKLAGKYSIPVRLGKQNAVLYHWALLLVGLACTIIYTFLVYQKPQQWLFLLAVPPVLYNGFRVQNTQDLATLDPLLKQMALTTLLFVITFGVGGLL